MPIKISMPALSPTMKKGNLVKWHKAEGDSVDAGDLLAEIETDKATMEVEAVDEGTLARIIVPAGTADVPVGSLIGVLLEEGETAQDLETLLKNQTDSSSSQDIDSSEEQKDGTRRLGAQSIENDAVFEAVSSSASERLVASPLAKRVATNHGIDIGTLRSQGTGPRGRIVRADVDRALQRAPQPAASSFLAPSLQESALFSGYEPPAEAQPLSTMQRVIAERLTLSKQTVPHFYVQIDVVMDNMLAFRQAFNERHAPHKISLNDVMIKAVATTLIQVPNLNVSFAGDHIRCYDTADISVAVGLPEGLITPVVRHAHTKGLLVISKEMKELVIKAREGKLAPQEFQGGTFSISNLGMYNIPSFSAILNPPQAGILAVGGLSEHVVLKGSEKARPSLEKRMTLTLSVDHRVVNGTDAATFLNTLKGLLENPAMMLA